MPAFRTGGGSRPENPGAKSIWNGASKKFSASDQAVRQTPSAEAAGVVRRQTVYGFGFAGGVGEACFSGGRMAERNRTGTTRAAFARWIIEWNGSTSCPHKCKKKGLAASSCGEPIWAMDTGVVQLNRGFQSPLTKNIKSIDTLLRDYPRQRRDSNHARIPV